MQSETLLERVRNRFNQTVPSGSDVDRLVVSIIKNLENILNHQQGSAMAMPDLGLPDFNSSRYGDGLENYRGMEGVIEACIRRYEPRCTNVRVTFEEQKDNTVSLSFKLNLSVVVDHKIVPLVFETVLGMDGRIFVEHA